MTIADRLATLLIQKGLPKTGVFVLQMTDENIRLLLRSGKTGAVRFLRKMGEGSLADAVEKGTVKLSGKELVFVLCSAASGAREELQKLTAKHREATAGLPGSSLPSATLANPAVGARVVPILH